MQFIDLSAQQRRIRSRIDAAIKRVLDHGQYIMGPEVDDLERRLAKYVGVKHVVGCSSGTDALLLPLMAFGVGQGDAVFTTPFTFFATCEMIALTGARPVLVDVDPNTYNIDLEKLEESIVRVKAQGEYTPRGIIPVDLFGLPADYSIIMQIAEKYGLFVLEDAAQAFGAEYNGQRAPGLAHVGATSFFPAKPLGCYGDGGAVFTDDDELAEKIRSLLVHGKGEDKYNNVRIGINARLDTIQAAILLEKLKIYDEEMELRQKVADYYTQGLCSLGKGAFDIITPEVPAGCKSAWAQYTLRSEHRDNLRARLKQAGIPTMVYYAKPMHLMEALVYLNYQLGAFPVAETLSNQVVSLPMHPYLSKESQEVILQALA